ncbi:MAG: lipopolysaccharide export system permease protein [Rhodobacteraceae bacterium]|uniref:LPS export ABC transporter permease LptF n=1 Tax=Cypionkella sp. TaxID=2811411 RepID=UPI0013247498|nr:LPS export ABC transporter permease LptF [Cypionkella sp.]KAF0172040.1 MAG: lipopolysaccharide export system permease protein [Paracoccaceae bacterium]MDO8328296.1 LPS export ABC transporter permease LptF [Cypionkella sp.]
MSRFDRYLLSQLLALFGFFSLVLVGVYWINRAVGLFEQLIGDGQSALVFLEFSVLTLPNVIRLVLPVSAFVAAVYVTNRLTSDSELVVMQATGFSAFRLARPVAYFGLIVALMMLLLMHVLVPASRGSLAARTAEVSQNISARFLKDGQFLHPAAGVTVYIREVAATGELLDLFLADDRDAAARVSYTAKKALFVRAAEGPKLLMVDGMVQALDAGTQRLSVTRFADFTYDMAGLIAVTGPQDRTMDELSTLDLLAASEAVQRETGESHAALLFEAHSRIAQPFTATAAALIGFGSLLLGAFSRFGLWRQILVAIALLLAVQGLQTLTTGLGIAREGGWLLAYVPPVVGIAIAAFELWLSQRPRRVGKPQPRPEALA